MEGKAMRTTKFFAVLAVVSIAALLLAVQLGAFEADDTRVIPLNDAYATFTQEGMRTAEEAAGNEAIDTVLDAIRESPPQMVLCVGTDIAAAVRSSAFSFVPHCITTRSWSVWRTS